jgi:hypothetical protein
MRLLCALKIWQMLTLVKQSGSSGMQFVKGLYSCAGVVIRRGFERVYMLLQKIWWGVLRRMVA